MVGINRSRLGVHITGAVLGLVLSATQALAGGGKVLPPEADPAGYSLAEAALATAYFNTGPRTADTLPAGFPFQILYSTPGQASRTFQVDPGTTLYLPIVFSDNSAPVLGDFPDVNDPEEVSDYYFSQEQFGAEFIEVVVDGKVTSLEPEFAVGAETPGLPTGGTLYTVAAVFLTPLSKGVHSVTIRARFTGDALDEFPEFFPGGVFEFEDTFTVIVR